MAGFIIKILNVFFILLCTMSLALIYINSFYVENIIAYGFVYTPVLFILMGLSIIIFNKSMDKLKSAIYSIEYKPSFLNKFCCCC
jgi:hypothetical protein